MGTISDKALAKVAGPAWDPLRLQFSEITETLLSVNSVSFADLTTIYIKFTLTSETSSPVYAVMWVKSSKQLVVGLALPENCAAVGLGPAPKGMTYKGLTGYFCVSQGMLVPVELADWAKRAYQNVQDQTPSK
jgi:hypothetical protein